MYRWRKLSPEQREETLARRRLQKNPWHSPPHHKEGKGCYLITSTCYEHQPVIGVTEERMESFSKDLLKLLGKHASRLDAWVVLPNHYHALVLTDSCPELLHALGRLHGRSSRFWNQEDDMAGRKVWFNTIERAISSDAHHITAIHYIHHNPVKHGHASRWDEWRWSSATEYLARLGREEAERRWKEYPLLNFGKGWDD